MMLLALLLAADPCALPEPAAERDPQAAKTYVSVGQDELDDGDEETAAAAFREALRLDPENAAARKALDAACAGARFGEGKRRLDAGDPRGAAEVLQRARPSLPAALLEGIARYQLDEDAEAKALFEQAAQDPELANAAKFYLALLAVRANDTAEAMKRLDEVPKTSPFAPAARELSRATRQSGKLVLTALAETGYDSNVSLLPSGVPGGGDGMASLAGAAIARPFGESGPWARAGGLLRTQFSLHDYDLAALSAGAGWQLGTSARHLGVEYGYDYLALGAAPFLSAHRIGADAATTFGQWLASAAYSVRFESYQNDASYPFSGTLHSAIALGGWRFKAGTLRAGWQLGRDVALEAETSFLEHGPRVLFDAQLAPRARLSADLSALFRSYDGLDSTLNIQRSDTLLDAAVVGELDLSELFTLRATVGSRRAISNVAELSYTRLFATVGVEVAAGFF